MLSQRIREVVWLFLWYSFSLLCFATASALSQGFLIVSRWACHQLTRVILVIRREGLWAVNWSNHFRYFWRLPFTPSGRLLFRFHNWYPSRLGSLLSLTDFCDPLWRPMSVLLRPSLPTLMELITDTGRLACEPISWVEEQGFGRLLSMRLCYSSCSRESRW